MKVKMVIAQIQRFFSVILGILAIIIIIDSPHSDVKWNYSFLSLVGIVCLGIYALALILNKRKMAGVFFSCCFIYLFLADMPEALSMPLSSLGWAVLTGSLGRFVIEVCLLVQGYIGLATLEKEKMQISTPIVSNNENNQKHCYKCKAPLENGANFCVECGEKVVIKS